MKGDEREGERKAEDSVCDRGAKIQRLSQPLEALRLS